MIKKEWQRTCEFQKEPTYPESFDTIIIGAGPAGMTAAIYAARRKMKALLICGNIGGQMMQSSDIENWTGVGQATGPELTKSFFQHVKKVDDDNAHFDLWVREDEKVTSIKGSFEEGFEVSTDGNKTFKAKTIICTMGKVPRTLNIPGEKIAMDGNGLSFCATCDAPLYRDKKMVVIGGGNSAMDVALQLEKFTDNVTIFCANDALRGEVCMIEKIENSPRIQIQYAIDSKEIFLNDENKVCGIRYVQNNEEKELQCEGIFEEIGQIPSTGFIKDFVSLNNINEIPTDRRCNTKVKGVFAGGDCSDQAHKQVVVAAGEGAICALEAHELILRS